MSRVYYYIDGVEKGNIIGPVTIGMVYIAKPLKQSSYTGNANQMSYTTLNKFYTEALDYIANFTIIYPEVINKLGLDLAVFESVNHLFMEFHAKLLLVNVINYDIFEVFTPLQTLEEWYAFSIARMLRVNCLDIYFPEYGEMTLSRKLQAICKDYRQILPTYKMLPLFYIKERAYNAVKSLEPKPDWILNEIDCYKNIIGSDTYDLVRKAI